jgi:hypothetical protein
VERIRFRGGRVVFIAMPWSGMVREIEARRYPRALFWDRFLQEFGAAGAHATYEPALQEFACPDGSHLDVRDRARFTLERVKVMRDRAEVGSDVVER